MKNDQLILKHGLPIRILLNHERMIYFRFCLSKLNMHVDEVLQVFGLKSILEDTKIAPIILVLIGNS